MLRSTFVLVSLITTQQALCVEIDVPKLAHAIYRAEGGAKTSWLYGVKCHKHTPAVAKQICMATIRHAQRDYAYDKVQKPSVETVTKINCNSQKSSFRLATTISKTKGASYATTPGKARHVANSARQRSSIPKVGDQHTPAVARSDAAQPSLNHLAEFVSFLASRYCPASVDPRGHANWKRNVLHFYTLPRKRA